ncbi:filamentous haemagglutinin family protein [Tardiphaga sp.]|uniref:filamentous haemagglutinin family protein n=1 Tax=Tardiphaga sp. TaxID=1926292 RepID=UPI00352B9BF8
MASNINKLQALSRYGALLTTVSAAALLMSMPLVHARSLNGSGGGVVSAPNIASDATALAAQQAAAAGRQSQDSLARAARAVQDIQALQAAARAAAATRQTSMTAPVNVPNGLGAGGLLPNMPAGWSGADAPTQGVDASGQTQVGIRQTTQQAILNWQSFNVGARTTLSFDQQGNANWVALNRVNSATAPSQILGTIKADGHVYVINPSGIIFGGSSQVNVGSLIASTAGITDSQFLSNGIYSTQTGNIYAPSFTAAGGKVVVEAGASISTRAPSSVTSGGGTVLLIGSQVENAGSIATPKGQTLLAAGDSFILRRGFGTEGNATSTTRGIELSPVIGVGSQSGGVSNSGLIFAQQGDITLAGRTLAQDGVLLASTSVNTRGTIHLLNAAADRQGSVTLGAGSVTAILPELDSSETALDSQRDALVASSAAANLLRAGSATGAFDNLSLLADRQDQSRIEIVTGGVVNFRNQSQTMAQGGQVAVSAGTRVFTETGASIDVSGVRGAVRPMAANQVLVNIQGNELRDSPVNRDSGALLNKNVWIDIRDLVLVPAGTGGYAGDRYYTKGGLLELGGYLANTAHTIGEWAALGGSITLAAPEVIAQQGARFDISGGSVSYDGGRIYSTRLIGTDGRLYSFDNAPADMKFVAAAGGFVRTHNIQGKVSDQLTEVWTSPLSRSSTWRYEAGYTVGRDAGRLNLSTPTAVFEADIIADTVAGERQTTKRANGVSDGYKLTQSTVAQNGTLALGKYDATGRVDLYASDVRISTVANVSAGLANGATAALPAERGNTVWLDADHLNAQKLGGLDLGTRGAITVDASLELANGGKVNLIAPVIDIKADIIARSGSVNATNVFVASNAGGLAAPLTLAGASTLTIHGGATIDLRGGWTNQLQGGAASELAYLDGGALSLISTHDIAVEAGSLIDVSSGAALLGNGSIKGGRGGDVTLSADIDGFSVAGGGSLRLAGAVSGYGFSGGGTLKLESGSAVMIGSPAAPGLALVLDVERFKSGFSSYDINGHAGLSVVAGTVLDVTVPVYALVAPGQEGVAGAGGREVWTPPLYLAPFPSNKIVQRAGADLVLRSQRQFEGGDIAIGADAQITVDAGRSISLIGGGTSQITVDGALHAKSGKIAIDIVTALTSAATSPSARENNRSIWIGERAVLDVAGIAVTAIDGRGRGSEKVLDGGAITMGGNIDWETTGASTTAPDIAVIIRSGALLDASGTHAVIDVLGPNGFVATDVASNGGTIVLKSSRSLYLDGMMRAQAGGAGAAGGTLAIALETPALSMNAAADDAVRVPREFIVSQIHRGSGLSADLVPNVADPALRYGTGRLGANQVADGGFGTLSLLVNGILSFDGDVTLSAAQSLRIYAGSYALTETAASNSNVSLNTSYLRLAGATRIPGDFQIMPTVTWRKGSSSRSSDARFSVTADLVEIRDRVGFGARGTVATKSGALVTMDRRGFGHVDVTSRGDVRLLGGKSGMGLSGGATTELASPGDLTLTAAQIYPASDVNAQLLAGATSGAYAAGSVLTISGYGTAVAAPQSVFGTLALGGDTILQGGVVRAPMGNLILGSDNRGNNTGRASLLSLLPGSVTSVSGAGVMMPYGGTTDGVSYSYNGTAIKPRALGTSGISLNGDSVIGEAGALLDLSGGGMLTGAGFISGRGGSVDVLRTPFVNANPTFPLSAAGNSVYAIVPSFGDAYAPVTADAGAGNPLVGQQITLTQDAGGLKAGTYTLLPSTYALMPGAFRVEIGKAGAVAGNTATLGNGSTISAGYLGIANTVIRNTLPSQLIVTSAATVRGHSTYNETGYDAYTVANAARLGGMRGQIDADAGSLTLEYSYSRPKPGVSMFKFDGTALFNPEAGSAGFGGTTSVVAQYIEILGTGAAPTAGYTGLSIHADDLNALGAPRLLVGGALQLDYADNFASFKAQANVIDVRSGAHLTGAEVFLMSYATWGGITIEQGASIDTIGRGRAVYDSTNGIVFNATTAGVVAVSNGLINLLPPVAEGFSSPGPIRIGECAGGGCSGITSILTEGTLAIATDKAFRLTPQTVYGAKNLALAVSSVNLGSDAALQQATANGQLPAGLSLNQGILDTLLAGNAAANVPKVETLTITARDSVNIFGSVVLDTFDPATGKSSIAQLVIGTPAIYGYGSAGDRAVITTEQFVWTGLAQKPSRYLSEGYAPNTPGAVIGGLLGSSTLDINAKNIILGYASGTQPIAIMPAERLALGFGMVNLIASDSVTSNAKGTLKVYQQQGSYDAATGYQYSGGNLSITAPVLTGVSGSDNAITAGGTIAVLAPAGATGTSTSLGAQLSLSAQNIRIDGAIALSSGKLTLNATGDILLDDRSRIDLAGRKLSYFEVNRYSAGGRLVMASTGGNITQTAGSVIDVSAVLNNGGSIEAVALGAGAGQVALGGTVLGSSSGWYDAGGTFVPAAGSEITIRAQAVNDFAGLNTRLTYGQVFGARRFQIKQGDIVIGDEVRARDVEITADGGSLIVNGTIDASGFEVGTIRLAARDNLTVNGTLDAHATGIRRDSYGKIIDSPNRAIVDLTTRDGTLTLGSTARIDLRFGTSDAAHHDGVARGTLTLNAPRIGGNDVAVDVVGTPTILGVKTIAVHGFRTYDDAPMAPTPDAAGQTTQLITQDYLNTIDGHSRTYIDAALANGALAARLAGLGNYHLRPGVEIVSNSAVNPDGNLTVLGDIDLSNWRYGPDSAPLNAARRGFGEPGALVLRAAGNLHVYGSITDGFAPPAATPADKGWYLSETSLPQFDKHNAYGADITIPIDGVVLDIGTVFPMKAALNFDISVAAMTLPVGTTLPVDAVLTGSYTFGAGTVLSANVYNADGSIRAAAGTVLTADLVADAGMKLGAGTPLRVAAEVAALVWPKNVVLPIAMKTVVQTTLARGSVIPSGTNVQLPGDSAVDLRPGAARSDNWAVAPMLPEGTTSWSIQLTAGADLASADRRATNPSSRGSIILADTHSNLTTEIKQVGGTIFVWTPYAVENGWGTEGDPIGNDDLWICDVLPDFCSASTVPIRDVTTVNYLSPAFSVVRTGSGDLGMVAARDLRMNSAFGVYTAGMQSAAILDGTGNNPFNLPRGQSVNGALPPIYDAAASTYQAWYPEHGGNLDIRVGRDLVGDVWGQMPHDNVNSSGVGNWLWRQGTGSAVTDASGIATSWWINFGTYTSAPISNQPASPYMAGFTGFGTLGGGNVTITAAGDAGIITPRGDIVLAASPRSQALVVAVGSTGRVDASGNLTLTGGGDLQIKIGGVLNPNLDAVQFASGRLSNSQNTGLNGTLTNLRGLTTLSASAVGGINTLYRANQKTLRGFDGDRTDVRPVDPFTSTVANSQGGIELLPGDSAIYLNTSGDLVLGTASDPGRVFTSNLSKLTASGTATIGQSWFSLWTDHTAINLMSAGGNLTPGTDAVIKPDIAAGSKLGNADTGDTAIVYPSILRAVAGAGSIYFGNSAGGGLSSTSSTLLAPSPKGALELLAGTSIYGGGYTIGMSGSDTPLPTPFRAAFVGYSADGRAAFSNTSPQGSLVDSQERSVIGVPDTYPLFAFGPDTIGRTMLHAGDPSSALFYAANGDIVGLSSGAIRTFDSVSSAGRTQLTWYRSGIATRVRASGDIINPNLVIVNNNSDDVSLLQAGRDITYANVQVAGPGTLEVTAGRNLDQADKASVTSIGPLVAGDNRPGASIAMMAGVGVNGPDYAMLAALYLDPANLAAAGVPLAHQIGKVAKTYEGELIAWLKERGNVAGSVEEARATFAALPPEQQRIFLRQVYFAELTAGGREYNDAASSRYGSYLRGRQMIATLFPDQDAQGNPIARRGDITMFGDAGVHTNFGGDIQMLAPSGKVVVGVEGTLPAGTSGVVTQGRGDIQIYSQGSVLLGLSRIMTTFGGNILAWSASGDINAGRGAKTTVLYTPPKRVYDNYGNVTLSPQVPSAGAGIATLNPIPEVKAGDIDLIAPLGTIDAGEAGIRVSGNINLAALQIVNAANIQVQGASSGIPTVQGPSITAALSTSNATAATQQTATPQQAANSNPSVIIVEVLGYGGGGDQKGDEERKHDQRDERRTQNPGSPVQVIGAGALEQAAIDQLTPDERRRLVR